MRRTILILLFSAVCAPAWAPAGGLNTPKVVIQTNFGDIGLELYAEQAPVTVDNFLQYTTTGFYDFLIFHRIIPGFMIQGGGYFIYQNTVYQAPRGDAIVNESYNGLSNLRGTIAMARSQDPNSATSEFYINHVDNPELDRSQAADGFGYCVFGRVLSGMDVVDTIAQVPTGNIGGGFTHFPSVPVYIVKARLAPPAYWLAGDLNNDGIVNFEDFALLAAGYAADSDSPEAQNGCDMEDMAILAQNWLETAEWRQ
ncbi:MAG: peptidylprolyl isomerase [Phycisphaerales bacterium]|nr:MAG: peptidylprolyl isomerase [Phycisphaerales bacterium]